jgi:hypothetical protein
VPQVVQEPVDEVSSALLTMDPPRWRHTLAHNNEGDLSSQCGKPPMNILSSEIPAQESPVCASETHHGQTLESASLSRPSYHDTEHEQAALMAEPVLERQGAKESLVESSSDPQQDTPDTSDSTRSGDLQAEPRDTPGARSGDEGEERSDQRNRCGESLKEATDSTLEPASFVEDEQHIAQPRAQSVGGKSNEVDEDKSINGDEGDEENEEKQTEQVEEEEEASSTHHVGDNDDGEPGASETPYMEPKPTKDDQELQDDVRGFRASSSARLAGGANNMHGLPSAEELVNMQGATIPSKTSVVPVSLNDVFSTPRQELEHGTETAQSISNDLVAIQADATEQQAEQLDLTTHQRDDMKEAQSHQSGGVFGEDEIVVANGPQCGPRSNGSVIDPRTKDTPDTGGHVHDLTDANDSSSDVEEDSDDTGSNDNTPSHARPRAKRASAANSSIPETPKKRRKMSTHFTEQTTCSVFNNIPDSLIQPTQIYHLIAGMLDKNHKHDTTSLTSFFFAIGSPYAIQSFREACRQVGSVQVSGPFPEETDARRSTRALDRIDMHDKVSPILRRYHLVQLVKRRDELHGDFDGVLYQREPKKLKYGLRTQPPPKALVGSKGAASKALERLMGEAYSNPLQDKGMESARYNQRLKELKNRLSAGHNWHALQARFGIGILALLPVGKEVGVWNSE